MKKESVVDTYINPREVTHTFIRGIDYAHHITDLPTHQFSDPLTALNHKTI